MLRPFIVKVSVLGYLPLYNICITITYNYFKNNYYNYYY